MTACDLVISDIVHIRHTAPKGGEGATISHKLARKGLSVWIDLDHLDEVGRQSILFSVGGFNLLSFSERDYGPNFKTKGEITPLNQYARELAAEVLPDVEIVSVKLLTFPRILGIAFNPISVYVLNDGSRDAAVIYEVRNTFGDMHSYVGVIEDNEKSVHHVEKKLHVSPFFSMDGGYRLKIRDGHEDLSLVINYHHDEIPLLTATLRGIKEEMSSLAILKGFARTRVFPMRPLMSIHIEAIKLWLKRVQYFRRPAPDPSLWTMIETSHKPNSVHNNAHNNVQVDLHRD